MRSQLHRRFSKLRRLAKRIARKSRRVTPMIVPAVFAAMILSMGSGKALANQPAMPEIDPGTMTSALALLAGGISLLTARRSN
jgi:hypothetical protein